MEKSCNCVREVGDVLFGEEKILGSFVFNLGGFGKGRL